MGEKAAAGRTDPFFQSDLTDDAPLIARRHLHDELRERLRDAIINGELAPDAKVPEKELCEKFGVSRTPLREALKVLAHEGLVTLNHNRGATVSPLTVADLDEAFPIYAQLEALAGELACARMTEEEIREIRQLHDDMVAHYRRRELKRHFEINEMIHERIQLGAHNGTLAQFLCTVSGRIRRARLYANVIESRLGDAIEEHEGIIAAIETRDGARLSLLLRGHMANTLNGIKGALARRATAAADGRKGWHSASGTV